MTADLSDCKFSCKFFSRMQQEREPILLRRNGKQQACDPCRRRKVACNHEHPVCSRCRKRREEASCIYIVQPQARHSSSPSSKSTRQSANKAQNSQQPYIPFSSEHPGGNNDVDETQDNADLVEGSQNNDDHGGRDSSPPDYFKSSGYLGPTSISAVLLETQQSLLGRAASPQMPLVDSERRSNRIAGNVRSTFEIQQAANILGQLPPDLGTILRIFNMIANPNDCWSRMAGKQLIIITWKTLSKCMSGAANVSELHKTVNNICSNTDRPLPEKDNSSSSSQWLASFSGQNTRWESIAIIFIYLALGTMASGVPSKEARKFLVTCKECCTSCISLAISRGNANTLLIYAIYKRSTIEAYIYGDASK